MWVAEYAPDGIAYQVFFNTEYEADEFCDYKNPADLKGIGLSFLWYFYEFKPEIMTLDKAKEKY